MDLRRLNYISQNSLSWMLPGRVGHKRGSCVRTGGQKEAAGVLWLPCAVTDRLTPQVSMKQQRPAAFSLLDLPGSMCGWRLAQGPWLQDSHASGAQTGADMPQSLLGACGSCVLFLPPALPAASRGPRAPKPAAQMSRRNHLARAHNCRKSCPVTDLSVRPSVSLPACLSMYLSSLPAVL